MELNNRQHDSENRRGRKLLPSGQLQEISIDALGKLTGGAQNEDRAVVRSTKKGASLPKYVKQNSKLVAQLQENDPEDPCHKVCPGTSILNSAAEGVAAFERFEGVAYGRSNKKRRDRETLEEFAFAGQAVRNERLWETLGTAASQKHQDSDSTAFTEGTEIPELNKQCYPSNNKTARPSKQCAEAKDQSGNLDRTTIDGRHREGTNKTPSASKSQCHPTSNEAARSKQNADTTDTDSESPVTSTKRPVTRSLTRKKASFPPNPKRSSGGNLSYNEAEAQCGNLHQTANDSFPLRLVFSERRKPEKLKQRTGGRHRVGTNKTPSHSTASKSWVSNKENLQSSNGNENVDSLCIGSLPKNVDSPKVLTNTLVAAAHYRDDTDDDGVVSIADSRVTINYEATTVSQHLTSELPSYLDGQDKFRRLHCNSWLMIAGNRFTGNDAWTCIIEGSREHFRTEGSYWSPRNFAKNAQIAMKDTAEGLESELFIVGYNLRRQRHEIWFATKS